MMRAARFQTSFSCNDHKKKIIIERLDESEQKSTELTKNNIIFK